MIFQRTIFLIFFSLVYSYGNNVNELSPKMTFIAKGSYNMGSYYGDKDEKPPHKVMIRNDFEISIYEVTVGEFNKFVKETDYITDAEKTNGCKVWLNSEWVYTKGINWKTPNYQQESKHPVVCVSWQDSVEYIKWLNSKTNGNYRLPTEEEWEYVAKAGTSTRWSFGNDKKKLKKYANIADQLTNYPWKERWSDGYKYTAPVGSYKKNKWGIYDMYGNVWEWCDANYTENYTKQSVNTDINKKVFRGASFINFPKSTRSANRFADIPSSRYNVIGFRLARTIKSINQK